MTIQRMIELLKIEMQCVSRKVRTNCYGCDECDLVQDDVELQLMYASVIELLQGLEPVKPVYGFGVDRCGNCNHEIDKYGGDKYCHSCGRRIDWDA